MMEAQWQVAPSPQSLVVGILVLPYSELSGYLVLELGCFDWINDSGCLSKSPQRMFSLWILAVVAVLSFFHF